MADVFVGPKSKAVAVGLLAAAEELKQPASIVRTNSKGYIVPKKVADAFQKAEKAELTAKVEAEKVEAEKVEAEKATEETGKAEASPPAKNTKEGAK